MAYNLKNVVVSSKKPSICFVGVINQTSSYGNTPLLPLKKQHWQCVNGPASSPHCLLKTVKWGFAFTSLFQRPTGVSANILQKTSHSFFFFVLFVARYILLFQPSEGSEQWPGPEIKSLGWQDGSVCVFPSCHFALVRLKYHAWRDSAPRVSAGFSETQCGVNVSNNWQLSPIHQQKHCFPFLHFTQDIFRWSQLQWVRNVTNGCQQKGTKKTTTFFVFYCGIFLLKFKDDAHCRHFEVSAGGGPNLWKKKTTAHSTPSAAYFHSHFGLSQPLSSQVTFFFDIFLFTKLLKSWHITSTFKKAKLSIFQSSVNTISKLGGCVVIFNSNLPRFWISVTQQRSEHILQWSQLFLVAKRQQNQD